ncbi:MAG: type IX secretion system protein PorQ [Bacteroidota bacterium]
MRITLILFLCLAAFTAWSQAGGQKAFEFLQMSGTARLSGLGGVNISLADRDINFFSANPALVSDTLAGFASVNYQAYLAKTSQTFFSYARPFRKIGMLSFGVLHMNYGTLQGYDASGQETGQFKSGETALLVSRSHQVSNFRLGATVKAVFSSLAGYRGNALMMDIGGVFIHPQQDLTVGLALKNLGFMISEFSETSQSKMPFDIQVGATIKPEHMPIRFSLTAFNLAKKALAYDDPKNADARPTSLEKILSHLNFGAEVLFHRNINLLVGYNYLNHQALKLSDGGGGAGLSLGFSARIKSVEFVFSRSGYVAGNAGYSFTLSMNIDKLITRR